jgi:hypothetical protein
MARRPPGRHETAGLVPAAAMPPAPSMTPLSCLGRFAQLHQRKSGRHDHDTRHIGPRSRPEPACGNGHAGHSRVRPNCTSSPTPSGPARRICGSRCVGRRRTAASALSSQAHTPSAAPARAHSCSPLAQAETAQCAPLSPGARAGGLSAASGAGARACEAARAPRRVRRRHTAARALALAARPVSAPSSSA